MGGVAGSVSMLRFFTFQIYLDYFMKGLAYEYRDSGVTFQTLLPFYVATRMTRFSSMLSKTSTWIPSAQGAHTVYFNSTSHFSYFVNFCFQKKKKEITEETDYRPIKVVVYFSIKWQMSLF